MIPFSSCEVSLRELFLKDRWNEIFGRTQKYPFLATLEAPKELIFENISKIRQSSKIEWLS